VNEARISARVISKKAIGMLSEFSLDSGTSRGQLGATRAAISGEYTRISPAAVPSAASLAHASYANVTGNRWVAGEDGCPAGWMVPSRE
jgi:hypothetical protein